MKHLKLIPATLVLICCIFSASAMADGHGGGGHGGGGGGWHGGGGGWHGGGGGWHGGGWHGGHGWHGGGWHGCYHHWNGGFWGGPVVNFGYYGYGGPYYSDGWYDPAYDYEDTPTYYTHRVVVYGGHSVGVEVQRELADRGYYGGAIDGVIGRQSRAAIRAYQVDRGLPVTGHIDGRLIHSLGID